MNVLVLGGTGVISRQIVKLLLENNHAVAVYNRGSRALPFSEEVRQLTGDRADRQEFESSMRRESFAFGDSGAHIVICSSIAAYKRPYRTVPTIESAEELHDDPTFSYAFDKAEAERYLAGVITEKNLPITIIRPSLTFGPGAANMGVLRQNYGIIDRIRAGKPLVMFGDGSTPFSFTFTPDLAKAFVGVLGNEKTFGDSGAHIVICSSIAAYKRPYRTVPTIESAEELHDDPTF
ncbi:MAG: NAD-dependent epimerase/dehydratase family protein, partial [Desulfofustis sp.]